MNEDEIQREAKAKAKAMIEDKGEEEEEDWAQSTWGKSGGGSTAAKAGPLEPQS